MSSDLESKRAIEEIKLRTPIEEVVRERVPELRKRGRLWEACCPFHEERTASFKVDPSRGTWRCFGACQVGGDVIAFVQRSQNLAFPEALELLAARAGVELPRRRGRSELADGDPGLAALAAADKFFQAELSGSAGRAAREYLRERGVSDNTIQAFGLGWAPRSGSTLVSVAQRLVGEGARGADPAAGDSADWAAWERTSLLRRSDDGRLYSFFRGRLTIPIRDLKGRTVGFGARRLESGDDAGPKYINTSETPWFHKGRIIYALDRAIDHVRRNGQLVLVEGYTDVMAAHQAGVPHVCAVLGTSTTEDHAALVRRSGARTVSLVFDGDAAGRKAAWRALHGLLPLDVELSVVSLPAGQDPADLIATGGAEAFLAAVELAPDWFDFVTQGLTDLRGRELALEVDRVLELLDRLSRPMHRDSLLVQLAERLNVPPTTVREAWRALPRQRRAAAAQAEGPGRATPGPAGELPEPPRKPVDPRVEAAYKHAVGAVLVDPGLVPRIRPWADRCPLDALTAVLRAILVLFEDENADLGPSSVMTALGDHPVRDRVLDLYEVARTSDYPAHQLLEESIGILENCLREHRMRNLRARISQLARAADAGDQEATRELQTVQSELSELHKGGGISVA